jgi:hypothetical protein
MAKLKTQIAKLRDNKLNLNVVPEGYLFKDCTREMLGSLPIIQSKGRVQYITDKGEIAIPKSMKDGKICLPFVEISVMIDGINMQNVEEKYNEYYGKIRILRFQYLNKLKGTIGKGGLLFI